MMDNFNFSIKHYNQMAQMLYDYYSKFSPCTITIQNFNKRDKEENTDMIVTFPDMGSRRICCRIRRYDYYVKFFRDIAIRYELPSKELTEWPKFKSGWGDAYIYCFESEDGSNIIAARLIDLHLLRNTNNIYESLVEPEKDDEGNIINQGIGNLHINNDDGVIFKCINLNNMPNIHGKKTLILKEWGHKFLKPNNLTIEQYTNVLQSNKSMLKW